MNVFYGKRMKITSLLLLFSLFICKVDCLPAADDNTSVYALQEYSFGVFPFLAPLTLEGIFSPIAAEMSEALKRPVRYKSAATFGKFMENLEAQQYDIAHIQPFDYVRIASKAGYQPVATRAEMLSAIFVVKQESKLRKPLDLKGKKVGLPPRAAAVSYLAKVALLQAGIKFEEDVSLQHYTTHQACLQALLIGDIDTCAAGPPVVRVFEGQTQLKLRIVLVSPEIPQTLFVVHNRVPAEDREIIRETLLTTLLGGVEPQIRKLFLPSAERNGIYFIPVTGGEYNDVRHYMEMIDGR